MMKYVTVSEMRAIEQEADRMGLTYARMMENAGTNLGIIVDQEYRTKTSRSVVGLIGSGNNGGDTLVALAYLANQGWKVIAYLVRERNLDDPLIQRVLERNGILISAQEDGEFQQLRIALQQSDVLLDGVLGTGFQLPLKDSIASVLKTVKEYLMALPSLHVVAVDCPSGVDCDSGEAAPEVIPAELTVTMAAVKAGLLKIPAHSLCGRIVVADIGLTDSYPTWRGTQRFVTDADWVKERVPIRSDDSHKGTFGTTFVLAGSENFTGAAYLAGKAAYLAGCGLVTMGVVRSVYQSLAGQLPEATWLILPDQEGFLSDSAIDQLRERFRSSDALLFGPGFGLHESTSKFVRSLLDIPSDQIPPLVVDADGLKLLSENEFWYKKLPEKTVLTPHPGEMSVLTGMRVAEIQAERISIAERFANLWGQIVVLKGAFTVVAEPNGRTAVNPVATSALAKAGSGDVLAGLISGLRAQGFDSFDSAVIGVWIHSQAGLLAAKRINTTRCVLASDVLDAIPTIFCELGR
ncbi:MAG: NAD(P)H-hydrate dehydratase [Anaerolineales bacterium]|nr:NAD(P)H-hydrate dehydratase [Anaerolineales bacterium]